MEKIKLPYVCILGGGAVRGLTYIGALEALKKLNVDIKKIAGSSVGSIFAAFYAVGYNTNELAGIFESVNFNIFKDINISLKPQLGISKGEVFYEFVKTHIEKKVYGDSYLKNNNPPITFKDIDMDVFIFASDLTNCEPKIFSKYTTPDFEIAKAVRISSTLPGLMTPVEIDGNMLVDGDLIKSWPLWLIDTNLNPQNYRVLEFRLEGTSPNNFNDIKGPISFANTVMTCLSSWATKHLIELYGNKDKFDYIVIDTKDLIIMDLNISKTQRDKLIELGYNATLNYFKRELPIKKNKLIKMYSNILNTLISTEDKITKARYIEAKYEMLELFYILCDLKYIIDTTVANKIHDFYKLYNESLYNVPILNIHKLRNKSVLIAKIMDIIKDLRFKEKELLEFNIAHINFKHLT